MAQGGSQYTFQKLLEECELPVQQNGQEIVDIFRKIQGVYHGNDCEKNLLVETAKDFQKELKNKKIKISDDGTKYLERLAKHGKDQPGPIDIKIESCGQRIPEDGVDIKGKSVKGSGANSPKQQRLPAKENEANKSKTFSLGTKSPEEFHGKLLEDAQKEEERLKTELAVTKKNYEDEKKKYEAQKLEHTKTEAALKNVENEIYSLKKELHNEKTARQNEVEELAKKLDDAYEHNEKLKGACRSLEKKAKSAEDRESKKAKEDFKSYQELKKDHEDLKNRFSKQAASKLADGNPDITDLSDPNRAMKLAETFSALYDDAWTDAYSNQTEKMKKSPQEAVQCLLKVIEDCYRFCQETEKIQMDSLKNILLHPYQQSSQFVVGTAKGLNQPRIGSKEEQTLKTLRRGIGMKTTAVIKQQFILKMQEKGQHSEDDRKLMAESMPFYEKCAEICWSLVLHDPPVVMVMDAKKGDKINPNKYTKLSSSGDKIDYLVWPPLAIAGSDGILNKGVVQPEGKDKKK